MNVASPMRRRSVLFLAAAVLSGGPAPAQTEPPAVFGELIEVRVVNVEAVVTDGSGRRVQGLTAESFRLEIDGLPVPIDFFTEIRAGQVIGSGAELPLGLGAATTTAWDGRVPTNFLVFIDDYFAIGAQRDVVLDSLAEHVELLGPNDQMAVLAFDGRRMEILSGWTNERGELRRTLETAAKRKAGGGFRRLEELTYRALLPGGDPITGGPGGVGSGLPFGSGGERLPFSLIERRRSELRGQIGKLVKAAAAGMRGLEAPAGRKVMLLLSGGWPLGPGGLDRPFATALFGTVEQREDGLELLRFQDGFDWYAALSDTANHLGYTLYPVDVPGAGWSGPDASSDGPAIGFDTSERAQEAVLKRLARQTGGRALLNGLRVEALGEALGDTRSYYWIGVHVAVREDDRRHRLGLVALDPRLEVRARRELVDPSRFAENKMLVEGGLLLAGERRGSLSIEPGTPRSVGRREVELPLTLGIPLAHVTLLPDGGKLLASLEISVGARDKHGTLSDVLTLPVLLAASRLSGADPGDEARIYYRLSATLRNERHDLVVSVRDLPSDRVLSGRIEVRP